MKTTLSRKAALAGALIASLVTTAYAGPGPQFWANFHKNSDTPAKLTAATSMCPGLHEVDATTLKPAWANGRGPLTEVKIGSERVCHMCPVTTAVTTHQWANGRGPALSSENTSAGPTHHCSTGCTMNSTGTT